MANNTNNYMSITSEEINFLIYRYFQESGFTHSAFTFSSECLLNESNINGSDVPPGALINYLQKGLQYNEIETHLSETGEPFECNQKFSLISPHTCSSKRTPSTRGRNEGARQKNQMEKTQQKNMEYTAEEVWTLEGHTGEVFICAWNPKHSYLASGSGDSTARIWQIPDISVTDPSKKKKLKVIELKHFNNKEKSKDVTTLDWNPNGQLLATGSYDGIARIWTKDGELKHTLVKHKGPIFSLKWNKKGDYLLSGSVDKTAIVWDGNTGEVKQQFEFHSAPTLDVDWRDNNSFATCSTDKTIYVCEIGKKTPIKQFQGHADEVNCLKWDPTGELLASCSDDYTAKLWSIKSDKCIHNFRSHSKEIYTLKWSPDSHFIATASFDSTVKVWDVALGAEKFTLQKHTDPVYSVAFSPNGEFLASGSFDRCLHIWSMTDGSLVKTYKGNSGIFEVCWNKQGNKIAASFSDNTVAVLDF